MAIYICKKKGGVGGTIQEKDAIVTPDARWSSAYTESVDVAPDDGYDAMTLVHVSTPMIRDNTLVTASGVSTPTTVYNGDTSQSNSDKCLKLAPTKTGMAYRESELYLKANSHLGDATANDVVAGKTFSSASGIQVTGTRQTNLQSKTVRATTSNQTVTPDSGYSGLSQVTVQPQIHSSTFNPYTQGDDMGQTHSYRYLNLDNFTVIPTGTIELTANGTYDMNKGKWGGEQGDYWRYAKVNVPPQYIPLPETTLWTNSSPTSSFSAQAVTLSKAVENFLFIAIFYRFYTSNNTSACDLFYAEDLDNSSITRRVIGIRGTTGETRVRPIQLTSSTTIHFSACYQTTTSSQSTSTAYIIPTKIVGIGEGSIGELDDGYEL